MAIQRQNNHPSIEIREIDRSEVAPAIVGTNALILGFADKGESYKPVDLVSISDLERNFGEPTNDAERYFHYGIREIINNNGNITAIKLPYNNVMDANYKYIGLKFEDTLTNCNGLSGWLSDPNYANLSGTLVPAAGVDGINYTLSGEVSDVGLLTNSDYDFIVESNDIFGSSVPADQHFIIVNEQKAPLGGQRENEGIFVLFYDYLDGMLAQRLFSAEDDLPMNQVLGVAVPSGSASFDPNNLHFDTWTNTYVSGVIEPTFENYTSNVSGEIRDTSFSEVIAKLFPTITFLDNGTRIDREQGQWLGVAVCSSTNDVNNEGKLSLQILETFTGSIRPGDRDPATGQTTYLPNIVNAQSRWIKMYGNSSTILNIPDQEDAILHVPSNYHRLINFTALESRKFIDGSKMVNYMDTAFDKVNDINNRQIDVVIDSGLSTISQFTNDNPGVGTEFDSEGDFDFDDSAEITSTSQVSTWRAVCTAFINFCQNVRRDCMTILDTPRQLELVGRNKRIRKTAPENTFSNTISPQLRYITGLNSSYAALYSNWRQSFDSYSGRNIWMPPTVSTGGVYIFNDRVANPWDAPAGYNRGILGRSTSVSDLAFNPTGKNQDDLYIKSINYATHEITNGFVLQGQKTTQTKSSAFDRVNVRRLFLRLERQTYQALKPFIYEPNNFSTRRRILSTLDPIFANVKSEGGIQDYKLIVDESNNTPEVIDRNELRVAVLIRPTRTAEFILVDFFAVSTGLSFSEVITF